MKSESLTEISPHSVQTCASERELWQRQVPVFNERRTSWRPAQRLGVALPIKIGCK
jgi:hypothetical protein